VDVALNWLWQGGVVALAAAAIFQMIPRSRPRARYGLAWAALAAVAVLPAVPLLGSALASPAAGPSALAVPPVAMPVAWWTSAAAALAAWALWAAVSASRTVLAILTLRRMRSQARHFPANVEAQLLHWSRVRTAGRRARLALSPGVRTAAVLGGRIPLIAVAPALVERLTPADLDRVVVHEWAHVQRRDDVAQIGARMLDAVAGWHPAVWWLERRLHIEREAACDDTAVHVTGSAKAYAACLTALAAMPADRFRVAALAVASGSGFGERVRRIVAVRAPTPARASGLMPAAGTVTVAAVTTLIGHMEIVRAIPALAAPRATIADRALPGASPVKAPADSEPPAGITRMPIQALEAAPIRFQEKATPAEAPPAGTGVVLPSTAIPLSGAPFALPDPDVAGMPAPASIPSAPPPSVTNAPFWAAAADAGRAVGAGSEQAAAATAGVFTRFAKRVARSF
jgi:beta-lactamase regulating signal transducer with metallopeptidase domain